MFLGLLLHAAPRLPLHVVPAQSYRAPGAVMGWSDPDWNWGYASGAAHVAAAEIRNRLNTAEVCCRAASK